MANLDTTAKYSVLGSASAKPLKPEAAPAGQAPAVTDVTGKGALRKSPSTGFFKGGLKEIGSSALESAVIGGAMAAGAVLYSGAGKCMRKEATRKELAKEALEKSAAGAAAAGLATVAALGLKEGGKAISRRIGAASLQRVASSNAATAVGFGLVETGLAAVSLAKGQSTKAEFGRRAASAAGGAAGGLGGALGGAALGTLILPGAGTAVGGFLGALGGGLGGRSLLDGLFGAIFR
jgi:hypothetical protein